MTDSIITAKEAKDISDSVIEIQQREKIQSLEQNNPKIFKELFSTISTAALKGETKTCFCKTDIELDSIFIEPLKWYLQNLGFTVKFKVSASTMGSCCYSFDIGW